MEDVHLIVERGEAYLCGKRSECGGLHTRARNNVTCSSCLAQMLAQDAGFEPRTEEQMPLSAASAGSHKSTSKVTHRHRERAWEALTGSTVVESTADVREWIVTGNTRGDYINWAPLKKLADQFSECLPQEDPPLRREVKEAVKVIEEIKSASTQGQGVASKVQLVGWIAALQQALRLGVFKSEDESSPDSADRPVYRTTEP